MPTPFSDISMQNDVFIVGKPVVNYKYTRLLVISNHLRVSF